MAVFIVALVLAAAASNTRGALSTTLWILAAASLSIAIYTRTPTGRAALAHRVAKAKAAAESEQNEKQRLTKPKPPKLLPLDKRGARGYTGIKGEPKTEESAPASLRIANLAQASGNRNLWRRWDLNPRLPACKAGALPG